MQGFVEGAAGGVSELSFGEMRQCEYVCMSICMPQTDRPGSAAVDVPAATASVKSFLLLWCACRERSAGTHDNNPTLAVSARMHACAGGSVKVGRLGGAATERAFATGVCPVSFACECVRASLAAGC